MSIQKKKKLLNDTYISIKGFYNEVVSLFELKEKIENDNDIDFISLLEEVSKDDKKVQLIRWPDWVTLKPIYKINGEEYNYLKITSQL